MTAYWSSQRAILVTFVLAMLMPNLFLIYSESFSVSTILANIAFPAAIYLLLAIITPKPGVMMLVSFPVMILGAFQLVVWKLFQGSVVAIDMVTNLMTTNVSEAGELLSNLTVPIIGVCVLYIPLLVLAVRSVRLKTSLGKSYRLRAVGVALALLVVGFSCTTISERRHPDFAIKYHIFPVNIVYNFEQSFVRWARSTAYEKSSEGFDYAITDKDNSSQRKIYIYVVGEASRAMSWSMFGYEKKTSPTLDTMANIVPMHDVLTESNTTHKSVPILLSSVSAIDYTNIFERKGIMKLFSQAGFKTAFISNQVPNRSLIDFFGNEADVRYDISPKDQQLFSINTFDGDAVPIVKELVEGSDEDLFIVFHTRGSHFNFRERYTEDCRPFPEDNYSNLTPAEQPLVINAYDNSVAYTDKVLSQLIDIIRGTDACTAMYYISDHGEDVMDDERGRFLHASPTLTYYQLHVASFAWFSDRYIAQYPQRYENAVKNSHAPLTSASAFHIVATMAGIESPYVKESYSPLTDKLERYPRLYLNDYEQAVDIYHRGLTDIDYKLFDKHRIEYDAQKIVKVVY